MLTMATRISILSTCFLFMACGPFILIPGGALDGSSSPSPADWAWTDEVSTIQLETRPEDPYSVNIWIVADGDKLYIHAGANRSAWVENMQAYPAVRVRIEDKIFDLIATRVEDQQEFDHFADGYEKKYGTRPRNSTVAEAYLYRLMAR
jgi:hypothetical protein